MSLEPLLVQTFAVQLHVAAAIGALVLGAVQLVGVKGTGVHRFLGWTWVMLMTVVAVSSFWIHEIRMLGPWSPIHLLSIFALINLPFAVMAARHHQVVRHKYFMVSLFAGALVLAGLFTLMPGRVMHTVVFGG